MSAAAKLWEKHHKEWRDPMQVISNWEAAANIDTKLLQFSTSGAFWDCLEEEGITLLVTREYEHLVLALSVIGGRPRISFLRVPHPSGIAIDSESSEAYLASTRNPNQIMNLKSFAKIIPRTDKNSLRQGKKINYFSVSRTTCFPGSLYMHDLALVRGDLFASSPGFNAIVRLDMSGKFAPVWWPKCIEKRGKPDFTKNYIQLNSIAAGDTISSSYFSASSAEISNRRPGHLHYQVDGRGVIFSGKTREPVVRGLTRPHSARLHRGKLWVDNSGYGELAMADGETARPITKLPGWTRGLCFAGSRAIVGTSRVIPKFSRYAPGLRVEKSKCGVHIISTKTAQIEGSIYWPNGNQIFAIDWLPSNKMAGFPFEYRRRGVSKEEISLFYAGSFE